MSGCQEIITCDVESEKKKKNLESSSGDLDDLEAEKKKMKMSNDEKKEDLEDVKMNNSSDDEKKKEKEKKYLPMCDSSDEELTESEILEYREYRKQMVSSGGFDIVRCPPFFPCTLSPLGPLNEGEKRYSKLCRFSELAIEDFNLEYGTHFEFVKYVKAVHGLCAGRKYYITFEAKEPSSHDDVAPTTFQALVHERIPTRDGPNLIENAEVILVRKKSDATLEDNQILLA